MYTHMHILFLRLVYSFCYPPVTKYLKSVVLVSNELRHVKRRNGVDNLMQNIQNCFLCVEIHMSLFLSHGF